MTKLTLGRCLKVFPFYERGDFCYRKRAPLNHASYQIARQDAIALHHASLAARECGVSTIIGGPSQSNRIIAHYHNS